MLGVSDAVIGSTIVAIGTSAPELAMTVVATLKADRDVAIGKRRQRHEARNTARTSNR
jgi:Ca2+/Na+ antiporter